MIFVQTFFQGDFFKEKLQIAEEKIESYERNLELLNSDIEHFKLETLSLINDVEKCQLEYQNLSNSTDDSPEIDSFESNGDIVISLIHQVDGARETDVCLGTSTNLGFVTTKSCCQADEIFLYDLENSEDLTIEKNSFWIEESICFINKTISFEFDFPSSNGTEKHLCSILMYDKIQGQFNEHYLEINTSDCFENPCELDFDSELYYNEIILNGTSIVCEHASHLGIVTKS